MSLGLLLGIMGRCRYVHFRGFCAFFLGSSPLPAGELQRTLKSRTARRAHLNFRFSELLVWNTRGNEGQRHGEGMRPFLRYIVTDRSHYPTKELSTDESRGCRARSRPRPPHHMG